MPSRVQISGSSLTDAVAGWYSFPINPIEFKNEDSQDIKIGRTLGGHSYEMIAVFDGRPRTMTWVNLPNKNSPIKYITLVANLKTMKNQAGYIRLKDLSGTEDNDTEQAIRVINVETAWFSGPASSNNVSNLKYDFVKLTYVHTQ